jgi:hypothetical protein
LSIVPRRMLLIAFALVALGVMTGCATSLIYDRADRLANRWVGGYLELAPSQQQVLDDGLLDLHLWHRREQLPLYADWLRGLAARLGDGKPFSPDELRALGTEMGAFWRLLAGAALPMMADIGAALDDDQVTVLLATLREERETELAAAARRDESWRQQRRARSMERFLRRWTGPLTAVQRAAIADWSRQLEPSRDAWLENRAGWLDDLEASLAHRPDPEPLLLAAEPLFVKPASRWSPEYAALVERNSATTTAFLAGFLAGLENQQRARATSRIERLAGQLDQLARGGG